MKHMTFVQWAVWLGFIYSVCSCQPRPDLKLWYTRPAERWEETLPLGNGRLGMMPDGGSRSGDYRPERYYDVVR